VTEGALTEAIAAELGSVLGGMLDAHAVVTPAAAAPEIRWTIALMLGGAVSGLVRIGFDGESASELTRQVMVLDAPPPDAAVADTLRELCGQAIGALAQRAELQGLRLASAATEPAPPAAAPAVYQFVVGEKLSTVVAFWSSTIDVTASREAHAHRPSVDAPHNLDVIMDIDLPLSVRFGEADVTLARLTRLAPGSILDLGRSPDEPVDVLINGRLVARGEVVVVSGNYGVRITEVISPSDRLRTVTA
jgi:flagellar motor switch protein FliN